MIFLKSGTPNGINHIHWVIETPFFDLPPLLYKELIFESPNVAKIVPFI